MIRSENKLDVSTMLERARKLEDEGSIDLADLKYLELTQTYPNELKALVQYARFLRIRGNSDAVKYLERARVDWTPRTRACWGSLSGPR